MELIYEPDTESIFTRIIEGRRIVNEKGIESETGKGLRNNRKKKKKLK